MDHWDIDKHVRVVSSLTSCSLFTTKSSFSLLLVCLHEQAELLLLADHRLHGNSKAKPFSWASPRNSGYYHFCFQSTLIRRRWIRSVHVFIHFIPIFSCLSFVTALTVMSADQIADVFSTYLILKPSNYLRDTCVYLSILKVFFNDQYWFSQLKVTFGGEKGLWTRGRPSTQ